MGKSDVKGLDGRGQAVLKQMKNLGLRRAARSYAANLHAIDSMSQLTIASDAPFEDTTEYGQESTLAIDVPEYSYHSDVGSDAEGEQSLASSSSQESPRLAFPSPTGLDAQDFEFLQTKGLEHCTSLKELGSGGYGNVDLVQVSLPSGRNIVAARKVIHSPLYGIARYERELRGLLLGGECPFMVDVYATRCNEDEGQYEFLLEYAPNGTMGDMLKAMEQRRRGKEKLLMPVNRVQYYAACLLQGLQFIHSRGQAHRDIKPGNVLMAANGRPMLADTDSMDAVTVTKRAGTTSYQAPELWRASLQGEGYTTDRADMYAFGITLAEIACHPAGGNGKLQQLKDDPAANTPDYVPADLKDLLCGLLAPTPGKRLTAEAAMKHRFFEGVDWEGLKEGPLGMPVQLRAAPAPSP
ncbi:hypothetical protein HYH02_008632 [Chlamydomonas schloesseri]|uniref:Protein kinase domain-containing protein n=1 Tax=Chlamydomonas schloesseri TaxID=2026947 RepID=A0A836B299_9CHLO|nr:hypothetical protein HYH02_008632 [Chlamydomonas schloesseri]|eukprot:KAG2445164.1 hypothetical protein HYH02_008632 [Chlamydomonas schloesseri]